MEQSSREAIIISLTHDTSELYDLTLSLDYHVTQKFVQERRTPDSKYFIGIGKLAQIQDFMKENTISLAVVNGTLKPSQWFNLEKELGVSVFDRIHLILEIFSNRANRKEARLQVKLAQYQYERPYVKELIHQARIGEHPGYMGGGEYQVDDYYEMIKKQMRRIKEDLQKIRQNRESHRRARRRGGFYLVSITGYTNAGKSSLLNALTGEHITVDNRLFSTLSTTTRRIDGDNQRGLPILLTDTVGFIRDLPHWLIQAFHATLEEIKLADVIVLLVDISEDATVIREKLEASVRELQEIGSQASIVMALNKIDLLTESEAAKMVQQLEGMGLIREGTYTPISIKTGKNIDTLVTLIQNNLPSVMKMRLILPSTTESQSFISWVHDTAKVLDIAYEKDVILTVECSTIMAHKIISRCNQLEGHASALGK